MLSFWEQTEAQEREQIMKMDDVVLTDLENMTHEDMNRLHNEELMMEELYVQAREAWALEHQKILQNEVSSAMQRRQEEIEEQRALRLQLHLDRLQDIEVRHKEQLEAETKLHELAVQQLREHYSREEQLQDDRNRLLLSTEQDVARATGSFQSILTSIEDVMKSLRAFKVAVEDSCRQLEAEQERSLEERRTALDTVKDLAASQCVSIEGERQQLGDTLLQLELLKTKVEKELNDEANWLTQQEAVFKGNHEDWERSYRRWTQQVQNERRMAEQRFREALTALQNSLTVLTQEERTIASESKALHSAFQRISETVDREVGRLEQKQTDLVEQQGKMSETLIDMEKEKEAALQQWRELQAEQTSVSAAKEDLRQEEQNLQQMSYALEVARRQVEAAYCQTAEMTEMLTPSLLSSVYQPPPPPPRPKQQPPHGVAAERSNRKKPSAPLKKDRLPHQVLALLRQQLDGVPSSAPYAVPAGDMCALPARHHQPSRRAEPVRPTSAKHARHHDPAQSPVLPAEVPRASSSLPTGSEFGSPSTLTTFTNLVNFSDDNDATSNSFSKF
ncbi:hypothetical protein STCU_09621 [Strigomonas culicis]|uniref:Uncharacterized protein n=1 Tax=Strigomonas culicis TaxID=28005 RepID=S9TLN3_9TRYP|nr:hypothetical protein STCU_09621 [Strigomonas culicis]|eukprot:EPY19097.1 hypothetical protein STCU_09621 [Strigomonas culicis]